MNRQLCIDYNSIKGNHSMKITYAFYFFLTTLITLCLSINFAHADQPDSQRVIRVGAYEKYPTIYTRDGKTMGLFPDILNSIAQQEGWDIQYVSGTWTECIERLRDSQIDIIPGVVYKKEMDEKYSFSEETVFVDWGRIYANTNVRIDSILDLEHKSVAVLKSCIHSTSEDGIITLTKKFSITCTFIEVDDPDQIFELLDEKKVDAGVVSRIFGSLLDYYYNINKTSIVFDPQELRLAYRKNDLPTESIIGKLDKKLNAWKEDPDSIFYRIIEVNLFGLPREWLLSGIPHDKIKRIPLTDTEQTWINNHPIIRLGIDPEFFPFENVSKDGDYQGIASDFIELLNDRLGLNMQVVEKSSWATAIKKIKEKEIDVLPCIGRTGERLSYVKYTRPYICFHRVIITRTDTPFLRGINDILDCKVSVQAKSSHEGYLKDHTSLNPIGYNSLQEALLAVSDGKADAFVGNIASATYWIRKMKLTNLKVAAPVSNELQTLHFGVRTDWPELVRLLNKGLASITPEERAEIERRWVIVEYKPGLDPKTVWKYVFQGIGVVTVIILIFVLWNYKLKREIEGRIKAEEELQNYQKNLEHIIAERTTELAESNHSLAQAQRIAHLGNWQWDIQTGSFHCTDEIYRIFNIEKYPTDINHERLIDSIHPDDRKIAMDSVAKASNEGTEYNIEYRIILPDESERIVHEKAEISLDENKTPLRITAAVQDITKRKQDEQAHKKLIKELEQKNAEMEMFFYTISHELKTPLITIEGFLGVLRSNISSGSYGNTEHYLDRITAANKMMHQILNELIELAKAGQFVNAKETVDFQELIQKAIDNLEGNLIDKNIDIKITLPENFSPIICDRKRLLEVVENLLENSIKFIGTVSNPSIEIGAVIEESGYIFYVKDNGIGIDRKYFETIFGLFNKLDPDKEGTGIGLALVKRIIEYHNGKIWVESGGLNKGSTFYFMLPKTG